MWNDKSIYLFSCWTDPEKRLGQAKHWAGSQSTAEDFFLLRLPAWDSAEILKFFFLFLDLHLVPLGHDPVDFHKGFVLRLRNDKEDVNHRGQADGTEDEEAVGPQSSLGNERRQNRDQRNTLVVYMTSFGHVEPCNSYKKSSHSDVYIVLVECLEVRGGSRLSSHTTTMDVLEATMDLLEKEGEGLLHKSN